MGGHMAHPPYPAWQYAADAGWAVCLAAGSIWLWRLRSPVAVAAAWICGFLVSYRFLFGSLGGMFMGLPL